MSPGPPLGDTAGDAAAHGSAGQVSLDLHVPGAVVTDLVGEDVKEVDLDRGTAQLWITDAFVQVRWFPGGQDPCRSFTVTASGGTVDAQRDAAIDLADRVVLPTDGPTADSAPTTSQAPGNSSDEAFAIWPETDRIQLSAEEPPWSSDMQETALVFTTVVLGWDDAAVIDSEPSEDGFRGGLFVVESASRGGSAVIRVAPLVGDRYRVYSVDSVGTDDSYASVSVNGDVAYADAGPSPDGTASRRVRFDYSGTVTEGPAGEEFRLGDRPTGSGSVLVFFLDDAGEIIGAWGTALPAGNFAAG